MIPPIALTVPRERVAATLRDALHARDGVVHAAGRGEMLAGAGPLGPANPAFVLRRSADIPGVVWHTGPVSAPRRLPGSDWLGSRRIGSGSEFGGGAEHCPALHMAAIPGGTVMRMAGTPVIVAADGMTIAADVSSEFAPLVKFYDFDAGARVAGARRIDGEAFVLVSDPGANYYHWLIDEMPRLALLRGRTDVTIVVSDDHAPWERETLDLLGIPASKIVAIGRDEALTATTLLVPDATNDMRHPGRKGAAWVVDWIRGGVGLAAMARPSAPESGAATRLYIGRADADWRKLRNEAALLRVLEPAGFVPVTLSGRSVAEQVALFARAEAVIGLHGAGLANTVFCGAGSSVLEIFTPIFGNACFGLLAASNGLRHATYVAEPGRWPPDGSLDCVLDVPAFWRAAEPWFRAAGR